LSDLPPLPPSVARSQHNESKPASSSFRNLKESKPAGDDIFAVSYIFLCSTYYSLSD
jgi:hypothetical protein